MATVGDLLKDKGNVLHTIEPRATVYAAIEKMVQYNIGSLLVCDEAGAPVGILTERDYLRRVALEGRASRTTLVEDIMTPDPIFVDPLDERRQVHAAHLSAPDPASPGEGAGGKACRDVVRWRHRAESGARPRQSDQRADELHPGAVRLTRWRSLAIAKVHITTVCESATPRGVGRICDRAG